MRLLAWLTGASSRVFRAERHLYPALVAYYWEGGIPTGRRVRDISASGAFVETSAQWYAGTLLNLTLQIPIVGNGTAETVESLTVTCRIVRQAPGGVGVAFMLGNASDRRVLHKFLRHVLAVRGVTSELPAGTEGQSLVEFALMVPLLFLLIVNAVNFGGFIYAWITVANAARTGVQYYVLGGASATLPQTATPATLQALVTQDISSLPNASSLEFSACQNDNGTVTAFVGTCPTVLSDPEAPLYVSGAVDVTYTYQPFIPLFQFPSLGIYATLPPTTIHRQATMRFLN